MGRNCSAGARLRVTPAGSSLRKRSRPKNSHLPLRTPTSTLSRGRAACRLRRDKDLIFGHL